MQCACAGLVGASHQTVLRGWLDWPDTCIALFVCAYKVLPTSYTHPVTFALLTHDALSTYLTDSPHVQPSC
jgi:hypothetical protein